MVNVINDMDGSCLKCFVREDILIYIYGCTNKYMNIFIYTDIWINKGKQEDTEETWGTQNPFIASQFCLTWAQHLGDNPKCNFFPLHLKCFSKVIVLLCGLVKRRDGGGPLCSRCDIEESCVNSQRLPSLSFGRSAGDIILGLIYHACFGCSKFASCG